MQLEQEMKLIVNSDAPIDLSSLDWSSLNNASDVNTNHLISTYYDTPDLYLRAEGVGLRMRQSEGVWLQTVKTSGHVKDGLHQREEWEHDLSGPEWDLVKLRQTPLAVMIDDDAIWQKLESLFTTDFMRETVQLTTVDGSQVELAYDRGQVYRGKENAPIHEIELELKSGDAAQLMILANQLQKQIALSPSDISKAQMGYALLR